MLKDFLEVLSQSSDTTRLGDVDVAFSHRRRAATEGDSRLRSQSSSNLTVQCSLGRMFCSKTYHYTMVGPALVRGHTASKDLIKHNAKTPVVIDDQAKKSIDPCTHA